MLVYFTGSFVYRKKECLHISREKVCQLISRCANTRLLEKTVCLPIEGVKCHVDLQINPYASPENQEKVLAIQAYFKLPDNRKSLKKLQYILNSYHRCAARLRVSVKDPKTDAVIAEEKSVSKPIGSDSSVIYMEIENLIPHGSIIYADTKYVVFEVKVELVCTERITARLGEDHGEDGGLVYVDYRCIHP